MSYAVEEIFYTLQGEGLNAGRAAVFCRFAGCNLWSGREADRAVAVCTFCDTDFVGLDGSDGGRYADPPALAAAVAAAWKGRTDAMRQLVVLTGGEPLLQVDAPLVQALKANGFEVAVETNGTVRPPAGIDWLCVSPRGRPPLAVDGGDELKLVFPQVDAPPSAFRHLRFRHWLLQPMDGPDLARNTAAAIAHCMGDPSWRLSIQTHKHLEIR